MGEVSEIDQYLQAADSTRAVSIYEERTSDQNPHYAIQRASICTRSLQALLFHINGRARLLETRYARTSILGLMPLQTISFPVVELD